MKNAVAIFGVPRSGTSWIGQIFNSSPKVAYRFQPLFSYAFKNRLNVLSSRDEILNFYNELIESNDDFILQKKAIDSERPVNFNKVNTEYLVWKEVRYLNLIPTLLTNSETKIIGIVRNPLAVIYSWYSAPREFKPEWNLIDEWRFAENKNENRPEEYFGYNKWKESIVSFSIYKRLFPDRFHIVNYDEMIRNPILESRKMFDFSGIDFDTQSEKFITESTGINEKGTYSVFRQKKLDNEWKQKLPVGLVKEVRRDFIASGFQAEYDFDLEF